METGSREPATGRWFGLQNTLAPEAARRILRSDKQTQFGQSCVNLLSPQTKLPRSCKYLQNVVLLWKKPEGKDNSRNI